MIAVYLYSISASSIVCYYRWRYERTQSRLVPWPGLFVSCCRAKCGWRGSNPHALRHKILSLAWLPITTHPQTNCKYTNFLILLKAPTLSRAESGIRRSGRPAGCPTGRSAGSPRGGRGSRCRLWDSGERVTACRRSLFPARGGKMHRARQRTRRRG